MHWFAFLDQLTMSLCRTFALKRGMVGASGTASTGGTEDTLLLPLWGQICCQLMAQPECATQLRTSGFINVQVRTKHCMWCPNQSVPLS